MMKCAIHTYGGPSSLECPPSELRCSRRFLAERYLSGAAPNCKRRRSRLLTSRAGPTMISARKLGFNHVRLSPIRAEQSSAEQPLEAAQVRYQLLRD